MKQFSATQRAALRELSAVWGDQPFVLVGAAALQARYAFYRDTLDLDVTIAVDMDDYPAGLENLSGWDRHPSLDHRWTGPNGVLVDVLPAGPQLQRLGFIEWKSGMRMKIIGYRHVFTACFEVFLEPDVSIRIAKPHVIAFLKMVSYLDRPADRSRDLADIAFLLEKYVGEDDERRWSDKALQSGLDFEDVPSFLLGLDLFEMLDSTEREIVAEFLATMESGWAIGTMLRDAPRSWNGREEILEARLCGFRIGFGLR